MLNIDDCNPSGNDGERGGLPRINAKDALPGKQHRTESFI